MTRRPAVFFDRDGVINEPPSGEKRYLTSWRDFRFIGGMPELLAKVKQRGYLTVLITNQQGVGKGMMSSDDLAALHCAMQRALAARGAAFDGIYVAAGLASTDRRRKPSPAMLQEAAGDLGIDLARSWMVGDHDDDIRAGQTAGTGTIRLLGRKPVTVASDHRANHAAGLWQVLDSVLH